MPLYNEEPARAAAALDAMASDLAARGACGHFDLFILSDTTDGDIALAEEEAVWALRRRLGEGPSIYYRRRERNTAHKSGNVREFCERWGRAYDHFLVLDADSLMEGATIIELVRRMENDPDAGLIQTVPRLHEGTTLVARLQQFAATGLRTGAGVGSRVVDGTRGQLLGTQRAHPIPRVHGFVRAAGAARSPSARRAHPESRLRRGRPAPSCRLERAHRRRPARLVRGLPGHPRRPGRPRPSLVSG